MTFIVQTDPLGIKGTDGLAIAAPGNPLDVQVQGGVLPKAMTFTALDQVTVTDPEGLLVAAGGPLRRVLIKVASSAANGICVNLGAAATAIKFLIEPGDLPLDIVTNQEIRAIRAGGVDVLVSILTGVP